MSIEMRLIAVFKQLGVSDIRAHVAQVFGGGDTGGVKFGFHHRSEVFDRGNRGHTDSLDTAQKRPEGAAACDGSITVRQRPLVVSPHA
jgi:hypothetical protein